jgi:signal transduction histidine kinase
VTDNFPNARRDGRRIALEAGYVETLQQTLDRLRLEVQELHASRKRLVLAADAERRRIERDLHNGVQQHLVALAVNVQLAGRLAGADPAAAKTLLHQMAADVQEALDETAQLAQRIYPPLLEPRGLAAALRSAAAKAGVVASVEVETGAMPPEIVAALYACWREVLESAGAGRASITVRDDGGAMHVEIVEDGGQPGPGFERLRDDVEALGGRLTTTIEPGPGTRISCSLPLPQ